MHMEVMEVILQDEVALGKYCLFFVVLSNVPELGLVVCFSSLFGSYNRLQFTDPLG